MNSSGDDEASLKHSPRRAPIDYLQLLKEQYNTLQTEHVELRRKYDLLAANPTCSDSFPSRLLQLAASLQGSEVYSDVKFVFNNASDEENGKPKTLPSHRIVIAARTSYWSNLEEKTEIVLDKSIDFDGFQKIYKWMYSDKIDLQMSDAELLKVCEITCFYKLESLQKVCVDQLSTRLDVQNCVLIYEFAEKQNLRELSDVCGSLIATSWNQFSSEHFASLTAPTAYKLIDRNTTHVLHSIIDIGREDVLFLYFMKNASKIPDILNELDKNNATGLEKALSTTENFGIAEQLVERGADLNMLDPSGESILMRMVRNKNMKACSFLLKNGSDGKLKQSKNGYNVAHIACEIAADAEVAEWVLDNYKELNVNEQDEENVTPLIRACELRNHHMIEALLKAKCDVNITANNGLSALSTALLATPSDMDIVNLLISNNADVNCRVDDSPILNNMIYRGCLKSVEVLLKAGVDVNLVDSEGKSSLHVAAECSKPVILKKILESRSKEEFVWSRDCSDHSALSYAVNSKHLDCAKILIEHGANVNEVDATGVSLLADVIQSGDDKTAVFLINNGAKPAENGVIEGKSFIEYCCQKGLLHTVRAFLSSGFSINSRASNGFPILETALQNGHLEVAKLLCEFGCDIESKVRVDGNDKVVSRNEEWRLEQTLLHHIIDCANQNAAVFLINNGADLNCRKIYRNPEEDDQFTPAHMAVSWGLHEVLSALIEKGADLNLLDSEGRTPCHIAVREKNTEAVKIILTSPETGFISSRDKFGQTILSQSMLNKDHTIAALIVERQPHAAVQTNGNGENLLHTAIRQNDLESVLFLLAVAKADATRPVSDGSNKTPLHLAAAVKNEMIIRNLILANDKIDMQSSDGCTPLHEALKCRNATNVAILLENGADSRVRDEHGENGLLCAMRSGSPDCLKLILTDGRCNRYSQNKLGFTCLHICAMLTVEKLPKRTNSGELCELLLAAEENTSPFNEKQFAAFVDARDADGNTALMIAYSQGNATVCRSLLRRRACMGARNNGDVNIFTYETATKQLLLGLLDSLEREPRWSDGETCDCGTKFSLTQRKHHCRHCGRHVCSKCSEATMPIAKYGEEKRVRVCDVCAHVISTGTAPRRI